jgi:hypothetical protein
MTHRIRRFAGRLILPAALAAGLAGCGDDDEVADVFVAVDRMAIPAINTALIPAGQKEAFNQADPANDVAQYRATAQNTITALRSAVAQVPGFPAEDLGIPPDVLAGILIPDVVTINFAQSVTFPNGRRLEDDVIDAALSLVLNRNGISDGIGNDSNFSGTFPYLAPANP